MEDDYTARVVSDAEYANLEKMSEPQESEYIGGSTSIIVSRGENRITVSLSFIANTNNNNLYLSRSHLHPSNSNSITGVHCNSCSNLWEVIQANKVGPLELGFTVQHKEKIIIPLTCDTAAGIISAFYNGTSDPLIRIQQIMRRREDISDDELGRILTTYYLSCWIYLPKESLEEFIVDGSLLGGLLVDRVLVPTNVRNDYTNLKTH